MLLLGLATYATAGTSRIVSENEFVESEAEEGG